VITSRVARAAVEGGRDDSRDRAEEIAAIFATRATSSSCAQLCGPAARHVTEAALDANFSALAAFCSQLLGWSVGHEEPGTTVLVASPSPILIVSSRRLTTWLCTSRSRPAVGSGVLGAGGRLDSGGRAPATSVLTLASER